MIEWNAELYQKKHSFVFEYGTSLIDIARPALGEVILDIGCGTGELTNQLLTAATQSVKGTIAESIDKPGTAIGDEITTTVVGSDADQNMINKAQEQFPLVKFLTVDIRSFLDEEQNAILEDRKIPKEYDLIFSNAALHWIPVNDIDNVIRSIAKLMKSDGGRLVVEFGGKGNIQSIVAACQEVLRDQYEVENCVLPWYFPSIAEFSTLLERHGIDVVSVELYDRPTKLVDPVDGMIDWLRMFGQPFIDAAISTYDRTSVGRTPTETDTAVTRHDKELLFLTAVNERLRSKLYDGTQWIADYRRIRVVGYRR